jgi:DNA repair exonuclease SbcCD ATPase subunit/predicted phosphodiesterase
MKLLITADWHVSPQRLEECEVALQQVLSLVRQHSVDAVVHLGDVKDAFNPVDVRVVNFLVRLATAVCQHTKLYVLLGNHDRTGPRDTAESILPVMQAAGARMFDQPAIVRVGQWSLAFAPYVRDLAQQSSMLEELADKCHRDAILFMHREVLGARWTQTAEPVARGVAGNAFARFAAVFAGHIHYPHQVSNVCYVGSPYCIDWGECNQQKSFVLVAAESDLRVERIASAIPGWYDPDLPGFAPPASWQGAHVRVRASGLVAEAERLAAQRYPGAVATVVPVADQTDNAQLDLPAADHQQVLRQYLIQRGFKNAEQMEAYLASRIGPVYVGIPSAVKFTHVQAQDVLCFQQVQLPLDTQGLVLVTGNNMDWGGRSNGSGKTSLLSLPALALFGATLKGQRHDAWRRRGTKGPSSVQLTMEVAGRSVQIIRQRAPSGLQLLVDGNDAAGTVHDVQRQIESLVRMDANVAGSALFLGQHEIATIVTGTDRMRKELFGRLLGLERYLQAQTRIRDDVRRCQQALADVEHEITTTKLLMQSERQRLQDLQNFDTGPEPDVESLQERESAAKQELARVHGLQGQVASKLSEQQSKLEDVVGRCAKLEERLSAIRRQLAASLRVGAQCPVCGSRVDPSQLAHHRQELESDARQIESELQALEQLREQLRKRTDQLSCQAEELRQQEMQLTGRLERLHRDRINADQQLLAQERARKLVEEGASRVRQLERHLVRHQQYRNWLLEQTQFLQDCLSVVSTDGLPAYLCATICPRLNRAADEFAELFAEGALRVQFVVSQGELDVSIQNTHGGVSVEDQSRGELRLAALIAAFALRDALVRSNLLVLDEPGEGLDAVNAARFAHALRQVAQRFGTVFVTTHSPFMLSELEPDRHYEVAKQNGIARLEALQ